MRDILRNALELLLALLVTPPRFVVLVVFLFAIDTIISVVWSDGRVNTIRQAGKVAISQLGFMVVAVLILTALTAFANAFVVWGWLIETSYMLLAVIILKSIVSNAPRINKIRQFTRYILREIKDRQRFMLNSDLDPDMNGAQIHANPEAVEQDEGTEHGAR